MKTMWKLGLTMTILLLAGVAGAEQIVNVQHVMDYRNNYWDEDLGVWFLVPQEAAEDPCDWGEDRWPYYRGSNEDWGWVHDLSTRVPLDATGIASATLTILGWDVNSNEGEDDVIMVNNQMIGMMTGVTRDWKAVTFTLSQAMLDELWRDKKISVFMDIDQILQVSIGYRVTLGSSTLSVNYYSSGTAPTLVPVYRFWSPVTSSHFYTTDESQRDTLINEYAAVWTYEGIAYQALPDVGNGTALPVYRFWSPLLSGHFFTISEADKEYVLSTYSSDVWTYEGIAFYAYPEGSQPSGSSPVYRFWSPLLSHHFFTISEADKESILANYTSDVWTYEGIAWYAFPN